MNPIEVPSDSTSPKMAADGVIVFSPDTREEEPTVTEGPVVNGHPTTITLLNATQLANSPFLSPLRPLMNIAFSQAHGDSKTLPTSMERVRTNTQMSEELGPEAYTYIISATPTTTLPTASEIPTVLGTVSFLPYHPPDPSTADTSEVAQIFAVPAEILGEGVVAWVLRLLVVDLNLQKQGIASRLVELVEAEVVRRSLAEAGATPVREVRMKLNSVKEITYSFYSKRGYSIWWEKKQPPGTLGSAAGFTVTSMSKTLYSKDT